MEGARYVLFPKRISYSFVSIYFVDYGSWEQDTWFTFISYIEL